MIAKITMIRVLLLIMVLCFSVFLFIIGKGHTLILDNNSLSIQGKELKSLEMVEVAIDTKDAEELGRAERIMVSVAGPNHRIKIRVMSLNQEVEKSVITQQFSLPLFRTMGVISIPALVAQCSQDIWNKEFVPEDEQKEPVYESMMQQSDADMQSAITQDSARKK